MLCISLGHSVWLYYLTTSVVRFLAQSVDVTTSGVRFRAQAVDV